MNAEQIIKRRCNEWAEQFSKEDIDPENDSYLRDLRKNFFQGLEQETENQIDDGDGGELKRRGSKPPKSAAFHSSTVLVVNLMQYWRKIGQLGALSEVLFGEGACTQLTFESKHPTGVRGEGRKKESKANLDAEFLGAGLHLAVEGKFSEPFSSKRKKTDLFRPVYFDKCHEQIWDKLSKCRELAWQIEKGEPEPLYFERLDAAQLLKHSLALTQKYGAKKFRLLLLWYKVSAPAGSKAEAQVSKLEEEIGFFRNHIAGEVNFESKTYQKVFDELREHRSAHPSYFDYMETRYFPEFKQ